jgi:ribosomal protein S18 acetylase RimI-like enzyme
LCPVQLGDGLFPKRVNKGCPTTIHAVGHRRVLFAANTVGRRSRPCIVANNVQRAESHSRTPSSLPDESLSLTPQPEEFLQCARLLLRHFSYVFAEFLPVYGPAVRQAKHAQILASVMRTFGGSHLLGWRAFRVIRSDERIMMVAVVSWSGAETDHFWRTVFAFVLAIGRTSAGQLPRCLLAAYRNRQILQPPASQHHDMAILYIAVDEGSQRQGAGSRLLALLQIEAHTQLLEGIIAAVRGYNGTARSFFQRCGFLPESQGEMDASGLLSYRKVVSGESESF